MIHRHISTLMRATLLAYAITALAACQYDEEVQLCNVSVSLVYPEGSIEPYEGVRVELKGADASVFVDSTDARGVAQFTVTPGIYEASSSATLTTYDWRYFFNGVKSLVVVEPDSTNNIALELTMSRKRIVH